MSLVSFLIDIVLFATAVTYAVKYYKFKKMAEMEFIDYERRLEEREDKQMEEEYLQKSEERLEKEEKGELTPEIEMARIEKEKQAKTLGNNVDLQPLMDKIDANSDLIKKVAGALYKKISNDLNKLG